MTINKSHQRCADIAEAVNDSIRDAGKFASFILNPNTCIVPLSSGRNGLRTEHLYDDGGQCVYCGETKEWQ